MKMTIQELLENKSFADLSEEERAMVTEQMTADEYTARRTAVLGAQRVFSQESRSMGPNKETRELALTALRKKSNKQKGVLFLVNRKIPAWMAAAASVMAFLFTYGFASEEDRLTTMDQKVKQVVDTVYVDKYITKVKEVASAPDTVVKYVQTVSNPGRESTEKPSPPSPPKSLAVGTSGLGMEQISGEADNLPIDIVQKAHGKSFRDDRVARIVLGLGD